MSKEFRNERKSRAQTVSAQFIHDQVGMLIVQLKQFLFLSPRQSTDVSNKHTPNSKLMHIVPDVAEVSQFNNRT